jgi:hypothetical protein
MDVLGMVRHQGVFVLQLFSSSSRPQLQSSCTGCSSHFALVAVPTGVETECLHCAPRWQVLFCGHA